MHKSKEYIGHSKKIIKFLLASELLFSLAIEGEFIIFNLKTGDIVKRIKFDNNFTGFMHPTTYINKLVFYGEGKMELWNIID